MSANNLKLSRRNFLAIMGVAGGSATLAACAGTSSTAPEAASGDSSAAGGSGEVTSLTWWSNHPAKSKDVELELISRFEQENPGITINLVDGGKNYEELAQKFNAALTGTDLPDIVVLSDVWWFNFALNKQITPVNELVSEAGIDPSTYVDSLYGDYELDGNYYAFPFARSTPLFYYNKEMWAAAGLPDRGPESWEEMDEWGAKLKETLDANQVGHVWGNAADYLAWTFEGPMWTLGGSYSDGWDLKFNDPATIKSVEWLRDTAADGGYARVSANHVQDFSAGLAASAIASTGDLSGILADSTFEVGTAALPNPNGDGGCPTGGAGLAIPAGISQERKVAAAKFIDFITNLQNTTYWSREVGYMPVRKDAASDPEQKAFLEENPNYQTALDQLPHTRSQDYARVFIPGADTRIGGAFEKILVQGADVTETMGELQKDVQSIYDVQIKPNL